MTGIPAKRELGNANPTRYDLNIAIFDTIQYIVPSLVVVVPLLVVVVVVVVVEVVQQQQQ